MVGRPRVRRLGSPTRHAIETWARERPDLDPSSYLFLIHIRRLGQLIERLHDRYSRQRFGLSGPDVHLLIVLRRSQDTQAPSAAELAEAQMVTTSAMAKQLDRLERLKLVKKLSSPDNGNGTAICATEQGLKVADEAMTALTAGSALSEMGRSLSKGDRDTLAQFCEKLLIDAETRQNSETSARVRRTKTR